MPGPNDTPMNGDNQDSGEPMQLSDDLKQFEVELLRLSPRDDRLNRERLLFLAGQAAAGPKEERATVLGMNLESRAWPAAFAAMSAVAAALLVMVISKPESTVLQRLPGGEFAHNDFRQIPTGRSDRRFVLSTMDAHHGDVEKLLARQDFVESGADAAPSPDEGRNERLLTPGRWHEILNESNSVGASPKGASNHFLSQGATS